MTKPPSWNSSPPSTGKRSRRSSSRSSSCGKATVRKHGGRVSDLPKATLLAALTRTTNYLVSNGLLVWSVPQQRLVFVAPTRATTPGSPTTLPSTATLPFWERMIHSAGGWARQTVDPGWWLRELGQWCFEEASRPLAPTASSSNGGASAPTSMATPDTLISLSACVGADIAPTLLSTPSSGTRRAPPSGAG